LIRAVEQLRRDGNPVKLLLCGGHSKSIDPRDVGHHAIFECGNVEDVAPFYAAADICVHPTFYDACSLVTLEAMAAGLAVITTRANGASELITHGVNGVVLDFPHNAHALTAALRPLVRDANIRRALGEAGRRLVKAHSVERNYLGIAAAYDEALALRSVSTAAISPLSVAARLPRMGNLRALGARKPLYRFLSGNAVGRPL
jgi:UDP-glucose:(heptosyl)LPS alpha-1,3-glucosyltransferase